MEMRDARAAITSSSEMIAALFDEAARPRASTADPTPLEASTETVSIDDIARTLESLATTLAAAAPATPQPAAEKLAASKAMHATRARTFDRASRAGEAAAQVHMRRSLWSTNTPLPVDAHLAHALRVASALHLTEAARKALEPGRAESAQRRAATLDSHPAPPASTAAALCADVEEWLASVPAIVDPARRAALSARLRAEGFASLALCATLSCRDAEGIVGEPCASDGVVVGDAAVEAAALVRAAAQLRSERTRRGHFLVREGAIHARAMEPRATGAGALATQTVESAVGALGSRVWARLFRSTAPPSSVASSVSLLTLHASPRAAPHALFRVGVATCNGAQLVLRAMDGSALLLSAPRGTPAADALALGAGWKACFNASSTAADAPERLAPPSASDDSSRSSDAITLHLSGVHGVTDLGVKLVSGPGGWGAVIARFLPLPNGNASPIKTRGWVEGMRITAVEGRNVETLPLEDIVRALELADGSPLELELGFRATRYSAVGGDGGDGDSGSRGGAEERRHAIALIDCSKGEGETARRASEDAELDAVARRYGADGLSALFDTIVAAVHAETLGSSSGSGTGGTSSGADATIDPTPTRRGRRRSTMVVMSARVISGDGGSAARAAQRAELCAEHPEVLAMHAKIIALGRQAWAVLDSAKKGIVTVRDAMEMYKRLGEHDRGVAEDAWRVSPSGCVRGCTRRRAAPSRSCSRAHPRPSPGPSSLHSPACL